MEEIIAKRTPRSKTYDIGGGVQRLVVGGAIAHHLKDGQYVDTDTTWHGTPDELTTGEFPGQIIVNGGTRAITLLLEGMSVPVTLVPLGNYKKSPDPTYSGNNIHFAGLWTGVDLDVYLMPEGIALHYTKTAEPCDDPGWTLPGDAAALLRGGESYGDMEQMEFIEVPHTLANGMYTLDFSAVPVGAVVS